MTSTKKPIHLLHFADAHIDMVTQGRLDPQSGLPVRVMDFLNSLDTIVDRAIEDQVDLVIFAGDAYKDRSPQPTYQREWGKRIMKLSRAGIPTILLVGNHDVARATYRAHTLHEYATLDVPHIHVADKIRLYTPEDLGIPVQVMAVPWVSPSGLLTREESAGLSIVDVYAQIENKLTMAIDQMIELADPDLPLILTAHASVEGAKYGSERNVMLGHEVVLSHGLVRRPEIDYVALGHIHQHQELNGGIHPPAVYPGSIERIDFGELRETKGFVMAQVAKGVTTWSFEKLKTRPFVAYEPDTPHAETFMEDLLRQLPLPEEVAGSVCRVSLTYPRDWEALLDEAAVLSRFEQALSVLLQKNRLTDRRARLGDTMAVEQMTPLELLDVYWDSTELDGEEKEAMQQLAAEILESINN